ncbi:hypothetical protein BE08_20510 [Sorangium cellulosum]|uniref:Secreted protein n=1 Tax=Sorangium cellulosum TaxID=56 RepID=A0A150P668_SORCE|nr:hypothetical protein BE08_20510 [Sorangium cellulosum]
MMFHSARFMQASLLAFIVAGSGCALFLGLDDFEDAPAPEDQSSTGSGDVSACNPDAVEQCYSGPQGTVNVGLCRAGTRTCDGNQSSWSACEGERLPDQESCASGEDENCDGFDCALWARTSGKEAVAHALAANKAGDIIAVGSFSESIQFGPEPLVSTGDSDIFIVAFDRTGKHLWSRKFGDAAAQEATSVSVDASDNIILTGANGGTINFGGPDIGPGLFVAKLSDNGEHTWSRSFSGNPISERTTQSFARTVRPKVESTRHGDIIISGTFKGDIEFDDTLLVSTPASTLDMYVAKLDGKTGSTSTEQGGWVRKFGSAGYDALTDVVVDRSDNIIITGEHHSSISFGDRPELGGLGMFLVKLDRDGTPTWSRGFSGGYPSALDVDRLGNITATGNYDKIIDFGGAAPLASREGYTAVFVAQFDASGEHVWSRDFEGRGHNTIGDISTDALNNIVLIGEFAKELIVDSNTLDHFELPSPWVLKLDSTGKTLWKKSNMSGGISFGIACKTDSSNEIIITGRHSHQIEFETGTLEAEGDALFIARLGI